MVRTSAETWNNAGFPALQIHKDNDVNKTLLLLLCISDIRSEIRLYEYL